MYSKSVNARREALESSLRNVTLAPLRFQVTETDQEARQKLADTQKQVNELESKLRKSNETITKLTPLKRSLSPDQREMLVEALKDGNDPKIAIRRDPQTPETQDYSEQFEAVFKEAGWGFIANYGEYAAWSVT